MRRISSLSGISGRKRLKKRYSEWFVVARTTQNPGFGELQSVRILFKKLISQFDLAGWTGISKQFVIFVLHSVPSAVHAI
jgi:hypothetical protein